MHEEPELATELQELRRRLAELEAKLGARPRRLRLRHRAPALAAAVGIVLGAVTSLAADGACPNGLPYCFTPNAPAMAVAVNHDFAQLKEWLEQKVGPAGSAAVTVTDDVRIQTGPTSNAATAAGKALFVSADTNTGAQPILELRKDDLSVGLALGYDTVSATGAQDLRLQAGTGGAVRVLSNLAVASDLTVSANTWGSGPTAQPWANRFTCNNTVANRRCPSGQFVCGINFRHQCGADWWNEDFTVECCGL